MQTNDKTNLKILFVCFFIFILLFCIVLQSVYSNGWSNKLDQAVYEASFSWETSLLTNLAKVLNLLFETVTIGIISAIILIYFIKKKHFLQAKLFSLGILLDVLLVSFFKQIIHRPRPLNGLITETSFSFPSGHATVATVFLGLILIMLTPYLKKYTPKMITILLMAILGLSVSLSRVYLHVHYLTDILGGILLGSIILIIVLMKKESLGVYLSKKN